jgi:hypothetical protein
MWFWLKHSELRQCILVLGACLAFMPASSTCAGNSIQLSPDSGTVVHQETRHYPEKWEQQCRMALSHFPELNNIRIHFVEKTRLAPLATTPTFRSLFRRHEKRTYTITISRKTIRMLDSILFKNLSTDAQIGVLGHELSHVADLKRFGFFGFLRHAFLYTFSKKYGDQFEFNTDRICIEHGLGFKLLAWSREVRRKLHKKQFFQEKSTDDMPERYMNPETILKEMEKMKTL